MPDNKDEWEKEQEGQRAGNIFAAAAFGLFALPFWFADVMFGVVVTFFFFTIFMIYVSSQPQSREEFEARREEPAERAHPQAASHRRSSDRSLSEKPVPCCPRCGSDRVRRLSGLDLDADAVDTFAETDGMIWPVCLSDYMCLRCGHKW